MNLLQLLNKPQQYGYIQMVDTEDPTKKITANFTMVSCCDEPDYRSIQALTTCVADVAPVYAATWDL